MSATANLCSSRRPSARVSGSRATSRSISAEAAGIIATLFTFSHLSFRFECDLLVEGYDRLHAYSSGHPEASEIFQAID